ncbi:putative phosphopyruvate hydratase [Lupinus albus]|uniref:phosphopyruvate hydratase n=1 Tax=Lupinus albus TaxID=3870 RepID=A0A6A4QL67_LUPAL|nr:putative phosphopyruvate hydratase [Lupinus albus]
MFISELLSQFVDYPVVSIHDPFDKEDWEHIKYFSGLGICQVVGGDLLMSNTKRVDRAITESACNALLLKVGQPSWNCYRGYEVSGETGKGSTLGVLLRIEEELGEEAVYAGEDWKQ